RESEEKQLRAAELLRLEHEAASEEERRILAEKRLAAEMEARRAKEEADRAEEEFRRTQAYIISASGGDRGKGAINLLGMVDRRHNAVLGTWEIQDNARLVSDRGSASRIEIPFQLPQEYDFQLLFERHSGAGGISIILSKGGRQFRCELAGEANTRSMFEIQTPEKGVEIP